MAHAIEMGEDGILRSAFIGDMGDTEMTAFMNDLELFLAQTTADKPLLVLHDAQQEGKFSTAARQKMAGLSQDRRIAKTAIINANAFTRVMVFFLSRVSKRDDVAGFFGNEAEAIHWLKE